MIKSEIVAHSLSPQGDEIISVLCTFPRIILAEVNTHRMLSKNTSSSRAIPFNKMVEAVKTNPFIPIAWQKEHKGMQGSEYHTDSEILDALNRNHLEARDYAIVMATHANDMQVTKQICNRYLEPFMWTTMLITGSRQGWDNFFNLRCPSYDLSQIEIGSYKGMTVNPLCKSWKDVLCRTGLDLFDQGPNKKDSLILIKLENYSNLEKLKLNKGQAEIHMMALAESIWDNVNESTPRQLKVGEWHIPFNDKISSSKIFDEIEILNPFYDIPTKVKISTAMAAHTSYTTVGNEPVKSYEKWIELHDKLIAYNPPHSSPMEHCARAMFQDEWESHTKGTILKIVNHQRVIDVSPESSGWCYNLKGFIPYRYFVDNKILL